MIEEPQANLEHRLQRWFAVEISRAAADIAAPTRRRPVRGRRPVGGRLALVGLLVAVVLGSVAIRLRTDLATTPMVSPSASQAETTTGPVPSDTSAPAVVLGEDGLPTSIEGERVLRGADAWTAVAAAVNSRPLLVGGWYQHPIRFCPANHPRKELHPLLPPCGGDYITSGSDKIDRGLPEVIPPETRPYDGPIVVRLHTHDPRASTCVATIRARCDAAIVIDEIVWRPEELVIAHRYPDGIPSEIRGEPVFRPADLGRDPTLVGESGRPFLLGGWSIPDVGLTESRGNMLAFVITSRPLPAGRVVLRVSLKPAGTCPPNARCAVRLPNVEVLEVIWSDP
jgi:hypothetical protein